MSILVDHEIRKLCEAGMVSPFDPELINPASLDVRLGTKLMVEQPHCSELREISIADKSESNPYWLVSSEFVLAPTLETFDLPNFISAQFALKSSRAREGLEHLMAGYCDPGWHGSVLTMELHNSRRYHPIALWPGMKIGQMVFHRTSAVPTRDYSITGRYNQNPTVTASKG